jgi:dihydroxyacetone kinase-like predicted kinase
MKGSIYKLTSPNTDMIYIGSTTTSLKQRLKGHIHNNNNDNQRSTSSKTIFDFGNVSIHLIRECECDNIKIEEQIEMDKYDGKICNNTRAYTSLELKTKQKSIYSKTYKQTDICKKYEADRHKTEKYKNYQKEYKKNYKKPDKYILDQKHYDYWKRCGGLRALSKLKPLFHDI